MWLSLLEDLCSICIREQWNDDDDKIFYLLHVLIIL